MFLSLYKSPPSSFITLSILLFSALLLIYRPGCASNYTWKDGLIHCDESDDTRQPTLEDVSTLLHDSWLFAARIFLPGMSEGEFY